MIIDVQEPLIEELRTTLLCVQGLASILVLISVAEWLRRWANLGVIATTELLGGRGFESDSRHE